MNVDTSRWESYSSAVTGEPLKILRAVWSPQLQNRRDILVHLPPAYAHSDKSYPVLYMHDAQNLFDPATSFNGETWRVDETLRALSREGIEAIVVAISHMGVERAQEYNPFNRGQKYLAFVTETVKPIIDRDFRTLKDRSHTGILGSSLGGLISLYAFFQPPFAFGFVGAMSPALWVNRFAILSHVKQSPFVEGRIYLDNGTHEGSAQVMYDLLLGRGYRANQDVRYVREEGGRHRESDWARRLPDALRFLLRSPAKDR